MTTIRIGPYELLEPLGEGGMGRVYRARDSRLGRIVAIKFLHARSAADGHRQLRFLREAKAEAALSHPNIATLLDVGEAVVDDPAIAPALEPGGKAEVPYLVLEFVPGRDLRDLAHDGPLSIEELVRIGRQIAAGLRAAHTAGVVHRDLKPGNIRVTPDGRVKILDFGLAHFAPGAAPTSDNVLEFATSEGAVVGTVPYLAPEQAVGGLVDARADLFSLGVLLYELASGELPFRGVGTADRLRAVLRDDPPPLDERVPGLPRRFVELVHALLEKEPSRRPHDAGQVEQELATLGRQMAEAPTSVTLPSNLVLRLEPARPRSAFRERLGRRGMAIVILGAAVAVAGGGYFYVDHRELSRAERLLAEGRRAAEIPDPQAPRIAAGLYERATRERPSLVPAWTELSHALVEAYRSDRVPDLLERAGAAADRAYALAPADPEAEISKARVERLQGHVQEALAILAKVPKEGDALYDLENELGESWDAAGDATKAEESYLAAIAARPDFWKGWNALGSFRANASNTTGARTAFLKAASLAPPNVTLPAENAASVLFLEGKYEEALAEFDTIHGPEVSAEAASNKGTLYFFNGRLDDAEHAFRDAIRIAPREPEFHRNLADTLLRLHRPEEARKEYEQALRFVDDLLAKNPEDIGDRLHKALYMARAGDCAGAIAYAGALELRLAPNANVDHDLARPFALCGDASHALELLGKAVALGYPASTLRDEDELAPLRGRPDFDRLTTTGSQ